MYHYRKNCALWQAALLVVLCLLMTGCFGDPQVNETKPTGPQQTTAPTASTAPAETTQPTEPTLGEASLEALRQTAEEAGCAFAVAYFGYHNTPDTDAPEDPYGILQEYATLLCEKYPFVKEIPTERVIGEYGHFFCIVPLDPEAEVAVSRCNWDEENGQYLYDDMIYSGNSGEPILLFCDAEDMSLRAQLYIAGETGEVYWVPGIDENLCVAPLVAENGEKLLWDFTDYWQLLATPYYNMVDDGWKFPVEELLEGTTWRVPWEGYWVTFHENTCDVGWLNEDWGPGGTYTAAPWELTYDEGFAILEIDFDRFAGVLKYDVLCSREQDLLYMQLDVATDAPDVGGEPLYRYLNPAVIPDPAEMEGVWELAWTEVEGYRDDTESGRRTVEITLNDSGAYDISYTDDEFSDWSFEHQGMEILWKSLYEGCGNDFWQASVNDLGYGDTTYAVALLEDGTLLLQRFWELDGAPMVGYEGYRRAE